MYQYDSLGRISYVVLPTGESINLASRLTADDELEVQISSPVQASVNMDSLVHTTTIKMEGHSNKRMMIREGLSISSTLLSAFLNQICFIIYPSLFLKQVFFTLSSTIFRSL